MNGSLNGINPKVTAVSKEEMLGLQAERLKQLSPAELERVGDIVELLSDDELSVDELEAWWKVEERRIERAKSRQQATAAAPATDAGQPVASDPEPYVIPEYLLVQFAYPLTLHLFQKVFLPPDILEGKYELTNIIDHMLDVLPDVLSEVDHTALAQYLAHVI